VVVVVKRPGTFDALEGLIDGRRVGEVDVGPSVAIVVDEDDTAAHGFDDVFLERGGAVFEGDARGCGNIFKLGNRAAATLGGPGAGRRGGRGIVSRAHLRGCNVEREEDDSKRFEESIVGAGSEQADCVLPFSFRRCLQLVMQ